jgi:hypothetical protein
MKESMPRTRKRHSPSLKAKVPSRPSRHTRTTQIANIVGVHPTQVGGRKKQALAGLPDVFGHGREQVRQERRPKWTSSTSRSATESGVGLSQKKSWPHRLKTAAYESIRNIGA